MSVDRATTRWHWGVAFFGLLGGLLATAHGQSPSTPLPAEEAPPARVLKTDRFRDPQAMHIPRPDYPSPELWQGGEGWVVVSMMVDPRGKPFEVGVVESTGNKDFEQLAVKAMQHASFQPATLNGSPVESVYEIRYTFQNQRFTPGAQPGFIGAYKALLAALAAHDRAAADAAMGQLKITTLYENAYYGVAEYTYASQWGNDSEREAGLQRAIGGAEYLERKELRAVLFANFNLQLQKRDFSEALLMWHRLVKAGLDKETVAQVQPTLEKIERLRTGPDAYSMSGTVSDLGTWSVQLFKRSFGAEAPAGAISRVKLKCSKHFASFPFDPALQYKVPESYGSCRLVLEGTPGTELTLIQS